MTDPVKTHRLICRIPNDQDSQLLHPIFSDAKAMTWFGPERVLSLEEAAQWVETHESLRSVEGFAPWTVCLKETGAVVGWGGLSRDSRDKRPFNELIYILDPSGWGPCPGLVELRIRRTRITRNRNECASSESSICCNS